MAQGDIHWFGQGLFECLSKQHDLANDVLKLSIVDASITPTITTVLPHFGGAGTTNFASAQVPTGGSSYTGPITLANKTLVQVAGVTKLRADIINAAQDASGFTNGRWGIIFNFTDASKRALGFVDLGGVISLVSAPLAIDWNGVSNDVLTGNPA